MNQNSSVRKLARCGLVAAIYVVLCLALQPLSYGAVQVRVAEALCLLPVFGTEYILGVVLGCFLANLLGSTIVDVIFGTLATLLACLVTYPGAVQRRDHRHRDCRHVPGPLFQRPDLAGLHHQRHLRWHRRADQLHRSGRAAGEDH